ncbi:hypothetical protein CCACVL1_18362 [Corchorus capsularis]|uniref:Uncharacterized protein n=1 Tax=Corchorus capsularis TaxID=210143 RepID=A0A1R3HLP3_COCAP|nr:hypothetical protein CCACVL1_18362 [Corchorus capsularis]
MLLNQSYDCLQSVGRFADRFDGLRSSQLNASLCVACERGLYGLKEHYGIEIHDTNYLAVRYFSALADARREENLVMNDQCFTALTGWLQSQEIVSQQERIIQLEQENVQLHSQAALISFHRIDCELYKQLVFILRRDPLRSMDVMALWIWMERMGIRNLIKKILFLPFVVIDGLADEAIFIMDNTLHSSSLTVLDWEEKTPLKKYLMMESSVGFECLLGDPRVLAVGTTLVFDKVCLEMLIDLVQDAIDMNECHDLSRDRTIVIEFPLSQAIESCEIENFFSEHYGECIESFHMQRKTLDVEPGSARMVIRSPFLVEAILDAKKKLNCLSTE